jgi:hypothetical protein
MRTSETFFTEILEIDGDLYRLRVGHRIKPWHFSINTASVLWIISQTESSVFLLGDTPFKKSPYHLFYDKVHSENHRFACLPTETAV